MKANENMLLRNNRGHFIGNLEVFRNTTASRNHITWYKYLIWGQNLDVSVICHPQMPRNAPPPIIAVLTPYSSMPNKLNKPNHSKNNLKLIHIFTKSKA